MEWKRQTHAPSPELVPGSEPTVTPPEYNETHRARRRIHAPLPRIHRQSRKPVPDASGRWRRPAVPPTTTRVSPARGKKNLQVRSAGGMKPRPNCNKIRITATVRRRECRTDAPLLFADGSSLRQWCNVGAVGESARIRSLTRSGKTSPAGWRNDLVVWRDRTVSSGLTSISCARSVAARRAQSIM